MRRAYGAGRFDSKNLKPMTYAKTLQTLCSYFKRHKDVKILSTKLHFKLYNKFSRAQIVILK